MSTYMTQNGVTRGTAFNHFSKWASSMFDTAKDGKVVYKISELGKPERSENRNTEN